jgi:hypothetical protein
MMRRSVGAGKSCLTVGCVRSALRSGVSNRSLNKGEDMKDFFMQFLFVFSLLFFIGTIVGFPIFCQLKSAEIEASLYNKKFGTSYTQREFFWSGHTIKSFLNEGKQETKNINISGAMPIKMVE